MSGNTCCVCHDPLLVPNDDDEGPSALPDDVLYPCGHHYHWQCALDRATTVCAACGADGRDADGKMLVTVSNEGGYVFTPSSSPSDARDRVTENFDLSEELEEEAFMLANPQIRRAETFLTLVEQGDWDEAESFLRDEPRVDANVTRRNSAQTALHMAAYNNECVSRLRLSSLAADILVQCGRDTRLARVRREEGRTRRFGSDTARVRFGGQGRRSRFVAGLNYVLLRTSRLL